MTSGSDALFSVVAADDDDEEEDEEKEDDDDDDDDDDEEEEEEESGKGFTMRSAALNAANMYEYISCMVNACFLRSVSSPF
tara:strand:+ start:181 stop:423 length:243 start_codon:yes stop_codon:yes gene_type:complete